MLLSGYQTAIQLAALAGFWAAYAAHSTFSDSSSLQWQIPVAVQLFIGVFLLLGTFLIPEAPRFLAENGKNDTAEKALSWLRCMPREHPEISEEMNDLQMVQTLQTPNRGFFQEIKQRNVRMRLSVGIGLMIAQNMVGLNALNYCETPQWNSMYPYKLR